MRYKMRATAWLYPGKAGWHFLTLSPKRSAEIKARFGVMKRKGWGALPVIATIGKTSWKTSIFPNSNAGAYLLPLKADVREKEEIEAGDSIEFQVEIKL